MAKEAAAAMGGRRLRERCCVLTDLLRRNVEVLVREARDVVALEEDYNRLQGGYVWLLARVGAAICRLLAGDAHALDVASDMLGAWLRAEDATRRDMRRMRLVSRALRGIPVSFLVKRAEETSERVSKLLPEAKPHKRCLKKAAAFHEQVKSFGPCLQQSSGTLQHLLYLTRALPLLRQFHDRLRECGVLDEPKHQHQPSPPPHTEPADAGDEDRCGGGGELCVSALYCGGPLWTRLTAEVCHHRCRPQRLAHMLAALPRRLLLSLSLSASTEPAAAQDRELDADLERELGLKVEPPQPPEPRGLKREAEHSPTRNPLIGMMEDEDDLPPIKIPQLDPSLFKPLLD